MDLFVLLVALASISVPVLGQFSFFGSHEGSSFEDLSSESSINSDVDVRQRYYKSSPRPPPHHHGERQRSHKAKRPSRELDNPKHGSKTSWVALMKLREPWDAPIRSRYRTRYLPIKMVESTSPSSSSSHFDGPHTAMTQAIVQRPVWLHQSDNSSDTPVSTSTTPLPITTIYNDLRTNELPDTLLPPNKDAVSEYATYNIALVAKHGKKRRPSQQASASNNILSVRPPVYRRPLKYFTYIKPIRPPPMVEHYPVLLDSEATVQMLRQFDGKLTTPPTEFYNYIPSSETPNILYQPLTTQAAPHEFGKTHSNDWIPIRSNRKPIIKHYHVDKHASPPHLGPSQQQSVHLTSSQSQQQENINQQVQHLLAGHQQLQNLQQKQTQQQGQQSQQQQNHQNQQQTQQNHQQSQQQTQQNHQNQQQQQTQQSQQNRQQQQNQEKKPTTIPPSEQDQLRAHYKALLAQMAQLKLASTSPTLVATTATTLQENTNTQSSPTSYVFSASNVKSEPQIFGHKITHSTNSDQSSKDKNPIEIFNAEYFLQQAQAAGANPTRRSSTVTHSIPRRRSTIVTRSTPWHRSSHKQAKPTWSPTQAQFDYYGEYAADNDYFTTHSKRLQNPAMLKPQPIGIRPTRGYNLGSTKPYNFHTNNIPTVKPTIAFSASNRYVVTAINSKVVSQKPTPAPTLAAPTSTVDPTIGEPVIVYPVNVSESHVTPATLSGARLNVKKQDVSTTTESGHAATEMEIIPAIGAEISRETTYYHAPVRSDAQFL